MSQDIGKDRTFLPEQVGPYGVEAVSPDAFALAQIDLHRMEVLASIDAMATRRKRPPQTRTEIIARLSRDLPAAMERLQGE